MPNTAELLQGRLQWLMFLRVVIATFLLGATVLLQLGETQSLMAPSLVGLYSLAAATYLLTLLYAFLLKRIKNLEAFAYGQIGVDLLLETVLVYLTGIEESGFSSIYNLSIITGSILLYRQGGLMAASASGFLYGGLLNLRYYGIFPFSVWDSGRLSPAVGSEIHYTILMNLAAFFLVAFLSSYLAEQVRISQRKLEETQSDLTELTVIHENILQCLNSGLMTTDLQGRVTYANQAACDLTGIPQEEILRQPLTRIFPNLLSEIAGDPAAGPIALEARRKIMVYDHPEGRRMNLGFSLVSLRSEDGRGMGNILHFQDLTQTMVMEEHLRRVDRLATIGEMAARIAHEIRNPLASLSGSIQVLHNELSLEGLNRRLMEIVLRETNRLNSLLSDFLLYARPERPKLEQMDLSSALEETLELFMEQERGTLRLEVFPEIQPGLVILADPKQMRQLVWNLLNNALDAMPDGGRLTVTAGWDDGAGAGASPPCARWVLLTVEDSGVGIPPDIRPRIYDPFFTTKDRGSGLGLSMVHRTMEDLGGRIEVKSEPGKGTRFSLWIPSNPEKGEQLS